MRKIFCISITILLFCSLVFSEERMVLVLSGSTGDDNGNIEIDYNFFIDKYEIRQSEFKVIMGFNPSYFQGDNNPVESLTWYDAVYFCNEKSRKEGLRPYYDISRIRRRGPHIIDAVIEERGGNGYRLPTSLEWEYAARGGFQGDSTLYAGSNDLSSVAWFSGNSQETTHQVGQKAPNELGLYDMSGNVFEFTSSARQRGYIVRGGSYDYSHAQCEISFLHVIDPDFRQNSLGFRIARNE